MKIRFKLDDEVVSEIKKPTVLTDLIEKIPGNDEASSGLEVLKQGAVVLTEGTTELARLNQEFVRDALADAVAIAQSFGRIRTPLDFIEHQVGVGVMVVSGAVTQIERVRDTMEVTGQTLQQVLQGSQVDQSEKAQN